MALLQRVFLHPSAAGVFAMDSAGLIWKLTDVVGEQFIHTTPVALRTYDCDALTIYKGVPSAVVLPESTWEVRRIVEICRESHVPLIARGAGTGLSGGATPLPRPSTRARARFPALPSGERLAMGLEASPAKAGPKPWP